MHFPQFCPVFRLTMWWVPTSSAFVLQILMFVLPLLKSHSHSCLRLCCPFTAVFFSGIVFSQSSPLFSFPLVLCLLLLFVSDSFCAPSPYSTTPLFQSEPPALAGLFRGRCTKVDQGDIQPNTPDVPYFVFACWKNALVQVRFWVEFLSSWRLISLLHYNM